MRESGIFIIAEVGQSHDGSLGQAHSYIDALAETGVNAVKFQTHIAEAESSKYEPFRTPFSYLNETRFEYWQRISFTPEQWHGIKLHCEEKQLEFLATPSSKAAVDLLIDLGVNKFKVGSGDADNLLLLEHIANTGKDIILSSGMSSFAELDTSVQYLKSRRNKVSLLQCTTSYPTDAREWGLNVMDDFRKRYKIPIGFSDHSGDIYACLAATAMGAEIIEFHTVFDKRMFGPDSGSSLTIDQIKSLVKGIRQIEVALNHPVDKTSNGSFDPVKSIFEKSLSVNKKLLKGHKLSITDLESKKPKWMGIPAKDYTKVIGRQLSNDLEQWAFFTENDLQ